MAKKCICTGVVLPDRAGVTISRATTSLDSTDGKKHWR